MVGVASIHTREKRRYQLFVHFIAETSANELTNRLIVDAVWICTIRAIDPFCSSEILRGARNAVGTHNS
ncbi:unannotated protein [freshwater metagenome]|uniref:Unannotated protein n=1 Tax=freshwater metagenome TaxID=449393 RepID=A0A6J5ZWB3_9ZZZZ